MGFLSCYFEYFTISEREDGLDHRHPCQHGEGEGEQGEGPHQRDGAAGVHRGRGAGAESGMASLKTSYRVTIHVVANLPLTAKKGRVLVHGPHTKTELLFSCQLLEV